VCSSDLGTRKGFAAGRADEVRAGERGARRSERAPAGERGYYTSWQFASQGAAALAGQDSQRRRPAGRNTALRPPACQGNG
jgi:hypothetical protein